MTIGSRIRKRREELHITQEELATKIGYKSRSSINKIEMNVQQLKQSKVLALAMALDTTVDYIMGWESDPDYVDNSDSRPDSLSYNDVIPIAKRIAQDPHLYELFDAVQDASPEEISAITSLVSTFMQNRSV